MEFLQSRLNEENELHYILLYLFSTFNEIVSRPNEEDISMYSARGGTVGVSLGHAECMATAQLCSIGFMFRFYIALDILRSAVSTQS